MSNLILTLINEVSAIQYANGLTIRSIAILRNGSGVDLN